MNETKAKQLKSLITFLLLETFYVAINGHYPVGSTLKTEVCQKFFCQKFFLTTFDTADKFTFIGL
jgi:hypothetical protein